MAWWIGGAGPGAERETRERDVNVGVGSVKVKLEAVEEREELARLSRLNHQHEDEG